MGNLVDEVNEVINSGKDVTKEMKGRYYSQIFDRGYIKFCSYNPKTNKVEYLHYGPIGENEFKKYKLDELKRFERIAKPQILPEAPLTHIPKNPNWSVDIGD